MWLLNTHKRIAQLKHWGAECWPLWLAILLYCMAVFTYPLSSNHVLYNLEPYPDGLFYVTPAWRFSQEKTWQLAYKEIVAFQPRVLPTYTTALTIGYLLVAHPAFFYGVNVLLGILSIIGLWALCRTITTEKIVHFLSLSVYLSHIYILWLPSLPLAENIGLTFFIWGFWGLCKKIHPRKTLYITSFSIGALALTKYNWVILAGTMASCLLFFLWRQKNHFFKESLVIYSLLGFGFIGFHLFSGFQPLSVLGAVSISTQLTAQPPPFYSLTYILPNLEMYVSGLLGNTSRFLWLFFPLSSIGMVGLFVSGVVLRFKQYHIRGDRVAWLIIITLLAQLPLVLPFYTMDLRYILLIVPLLSVGACLFLAGWKQTYKKYMLALCIFGFHIVINAQFIKTLIVTNWFQRSQAWQYEAIKHIDAQLSSAISSPDQYLVTALPPFLFEVYSPGKYTVLPLSIHQEFIQKQQKVWGDKWNYIEPERNIDSLLSQGKKVYITNAYITADSQVIRDFESLKQRYTIQLVADGCASTCSLYKVLKRND